MIIFSFAYDPETKKEVFAGNIGYIEALTILQQLAVNELTKRAIEQAKTEAHNEK